MAAKAQLRWFTGMATVTVDVDTDTGAVDEIEPIEEDSVVRVRRSDGSVSVFRGMAETRIWEE